MGGVDVAGDCFAGPAAAVGVNGGNRFAHFYAVLAQGDSIADWREEGTIVAGGHDGGSAICEGGASKKWQFNAVSAVTLIGEKDQHYAAGAEFGFELIGSAAAIKQGNAAASAKAAHVSVETGLANAAVS